MTGEDCGKDRSGGGGAQRKESKVAHLATLSFLTIQDPKKESKTSENEYRRRDQHAGEGKLERNTNKSAEASGDRALIAPHTLSKGQEGESGKERVREEAERYHGREGGVGGGGRNQKRVEKVAVHEG